jgi:uncharacterized membrane protein
MEKDNEKKKSESSSFGVVWLPIGLSLGVVFGLLFDNLAMGVAIGMFAGTIIDLLSDEEEAADQ